MTHQAPHPQPRPKFAQWMFERSLKPQDVAGAIDCSREHVRLICLPVDDPARRNPSQKIRQKIAAYTHGAIGLDDWPPAPRAVAPELEGVL